MLLSVRSLLAECNRKSRHDNLGLPSVNQRPERNKHFQGFDETEGGIGGGFQQLQGPAF